MNNYFDMIYIINFTKSKSKIIEEMTNFNIKNYIIKDKIKKEISLEKIKRNHLWAYPGNTFFCNQKCICGGEGHDLNIEEINKYRLHNDIWKDIIINNLE